MANNQAFAMRGDAQDAALGGPMQLVNANMLPDARVAEHAHRRQTKTAHTEIPFGHSVYAVGYERHRQGIP